MVRVGRDLKDQISKIHVNHLPLAVAASKLSIISAFPLLTGDAGGLY